MQVPAPSAAAFRGMRLLPALEEEMLALRHLVPTGGVCVDIGASYGTYTVVLARLVGPEGRVHAVEPRPRSRHVLRAACRTLCPPNVIVHDVALAEDDRELLLLTPRRRWGLPVPGRSFLVDVGPSTVDKGHEYGGGDRLEPVDCTTLDRLVERARLERLDLVKIDVEGGELDVLRGGEQVLIEHRPILLCEIEDRHTQRYGHHAVAVFEWLGERGWDPHVYGPSGLRETDGPVIGRINYVFVPRA